ncbi:MAG TPA: hypothetical protein VF158_14500 [Longimicrobiales bacterium]
MSGAALYRREATIAGVRLELTYGAEGYTLSADGRALGSVRDEAAALRAWAKLTRRLRAAERKATLPAGCVQMRRARSTGCLVGVYYAPEAGMDDDEGRAPWSTVCEEHGHVCAHETRALAVAHAAAPEGWCEACKGLTGE